MKKYKYVRFDDGKIVSFSEFNRNFNSYDGRYCKDVVDLLEENDMVRIEYFLPKEDKRVNQLFQVESVTGDNYYVVLKNAYMNFIIKNNEFNHEELNPLIKAIIPNEKIKNIEYHLDEKQNDYTLPSSIKEMASGLIELYGIAYIQIRPQVANIINNNVTNIAYIENVLDQLLNIPYKPCYQLFIKLCNYVSTFDKDCANDYLEIYEDLYGEEEVKEKKKTM